MIVVLLLIAFVTVVLVVLLVAVGWCVSLLFRCARSCYRRPRRTSFWRWPTTCAYLFGLVMIRHLMIWLGADPGRQHSGPFALFGLSLGLGLTLWERAWDARKRREAA